MADFTWPDDLEPSSMWMLPESNTLSQESPITRRDRTVLLDGDRWRCGLTFDLISRARSQRLEATIGQLRGRLYTIAIWDFDREFPLGPNLDRGSLADTLWGDDTTFTDDTGWDGGEAGVRVWRAHAAGVMRVRVDGFLQYTTPLFAADRVELSGRIYMLTADAVADGLGRAYLYLHRPLLTPAAHLDLVTRSRASSPFILRSDDQLRRQSDAAHRSQITLEFVERL